jgi:hypothetical protein
MNSRTMARLTDYPVDHMMTRPIKELNICSKAGYTYNTSVLTSSLRIPEYHQLPTSLYTASDASPGGTDDDEL